MNMQLIELIKQVQDMEKSLHEAEYILEVSRKIISSGIYTKADRKIFEWNLKNVSQLSVKRNIAQRQLLDFLRVA